jgi:hypothetical protein
VVPLQEVTKNNLVLVILKIGFEGGQMPLQRRVPKFGFTNINRKDYEGVNLTFCFLVDNGVLKILLI